MARSTQLVILTKTICTGMSQKSLPTKFPPGKQNSVSHTSFLTVS